MASFNYGWDIPLLQHDDHNDQLPFVAREDPPSDVEISNKPKIVDDSQSGIQQRVVIPNPFAVAQAKSPDRRSQHSTRNHYSTNRGHPYYHVRKHNRERSESPDQDHEHDRQRQYSRFSSNGRSRDHNRDSRMGDNCSDDFDCEHSSSLKWSPRTYSGRNQQQRKSPHYSREPDSKKIGGPCSSCGFKERDDTLSFRQRNKSSYGEYKEMDSNQHKANCYEQFRYPACNFQRKSGDHSKLYDAYQQCPEKSSSSPQSTQITNPIDIMAVASKIEIDVSVMNNIKLSLMMSGTTSRIQEVSHSPPKRSMSPHSVHSTRNHCTSRWADGKSLTPSDSNLAIPAISNTRYSYSEQGTRKRPPYRDHTTSVVSRPIPVRASNMPDDIRKPQGGSTHPEFRVLTAVPRPHEARYSQLHNDPRVSNGKLFPVQNKFWVNANQMFAERKSPFEKCQEKFDIPGLDVPRNSIAASPRIVNRPPLPPNLVMKTTSNQVKGCNRNPVPSNDMTQSQVQRRHDSGGDARKNCQQMLDIPPSRTTVTHDATRFRPSSLVTKAIPHENQCSDQNLIPSMTKPSVEQRRDAGSNLLTCDICTSFVVCLVLHYVNLHPEREVPCKLNNKELQTAIQECQVASEDHCGDSDSNNANDEMPVDDLSWLPAGNVFEDAVCCKYCNVESNMRYYMVEHVKTHAGKRNIQKPVKPKVRRVPSTELFCRLCEFKTLDMSEFCEHVSGHTGEFAYGCGYCSYRCPTMAQAKSHVLNQHANKKTSINVTIEKKVPEKFLEGYACSLCGFVQLDSNRTASHIKSKHAQEPNALIVAINMSRTVYKVVSAEQNSSTDAGKSSAEKDRAKTDVSIPMSSKETTTADLLSPVAEKPKEQPLEKPAHEKSIPKESDKQQNNASVSEGKCSTKKSDRNNCQPAKMLTESRKTEKKQGALGKSAATIWKANPAKLNDTVAKLRAQLVKDGASIAAAEAEMTVEKSPLENKSYHEKLQSWATREKTYICGMPCCVSVFTSEYALASHRDFIHKDLTMALCRECDLTLPSIGEFLKHLRGPAHAEFKKKFVCSAESVCQFTSVSGKIFMEHINKKHLDKKWLTCFWCNKKVLTSQALAEHIESKCNTQKRLIAAYVKYGLAGLPDDLSDIEDDERNKERDGHLRCDETRSSDSPFSTDAEQDIESDRCDNNEIHKRRRPSVVLGTGKLSLDKQLEPEGEISLKRAISSEDTGSGLSETPSVKRAKIDDKNKQDEAAVSSTIQVVPVGGKTAEDLSCKKAESLEKKSTLHNIVVQQNVNKTNLGHKDAKCNNPVSAVEGNKPPLNPKVSPKPIPDPTLLIRHQSSRPFSSAVLPSFSQGKPVTPMKVVTLEPKTLSSGAPVPLQKDVDSELPIQIVSVVSLASSSSSQATSQHGDQKKDPSPAVKNLSDDDDVNATNDPPVTDIADIYGALAASCILITASSLPADSLSFDKYHASVRKDAASPNVERAAIRKTKKPHSAMLTKSSLRHLYKCAGNHCAYTTGDESNFLKHMSDVKKEKDRVCVYCLKVFHGAETLVHHVREAHGTSAYQCAHCFYRAHTEMMILLHTHLHHSDLQAKSLLVPTTGDDPKLDPPTAKDVLKFVKPFVCGQDLCSYASVEEEDFKLHLKNAHVTLNKFKCFYCPKSLDGDVLLIHLKEHGIRKYHCLLCEWGTDDDTASMVHMCENHSEQPGRLYMRGGCNSKMFQMAVSVDRVKQCDPPKVPTPDTSLLAGEDAWDVANTTSGNNPEKYKCGYSNCQFTAHDVTRLESHMKMCYLINKGHSLQCPTCKILFHDQAAYSAHVPSHDVRRYSCGLCTFRAQLPHYVKHHIRSHHRIPFEEMKCVTLNQSDDLDSAEFVFVQKSHNSPQKVTSANRNSLAVASEENSAVIESLDNVPQQSIFQKEKMCAWCGYSTKVRVNLVRHLEKHRSQPLTFPLPTPACPRSPEPTPSCSSITTERPASPPVQNIVEEAEPRGNDKIQAKWNDVPDQEYPQYVPPNELYRCSISGCHYLAVDRSLYEFHINTLHGNCRVLPCPHCPEQPHTVAVLIRHLRLHGSSLYRCSECEFLGMSQHSIKIHAVGTHGAFSSYTIIRDGDCDSAVGRPACNRQLGEPESGNKSSRHGCGGNAKAADVVWECGICDLTMASRMEVKKHLSEKHLLSVLYRCSVCGHGEKTHAQVLQHFVSTHPRTEVKIQDLVRWRVRGERNSPEKGRKSPGKRQEMSSATSPEKRFSCYLCNSYKSNYKGDMRLHIFREMGYSKYSCGFCEMRFFSQKPAKKHNCRNSQKQPPDINVEVDEELERDVNARLKSQEVKVSSQCDEPTIDNNDPLPVDFESCELLETASQLNANDPENFSEEFLFKCPLCPYKTNAKSALRKHLLRHLNYKPYKCGHCGARFPKPKPCLSHHDSQHDGQPVNIENDVDQRCLKFVSWVMKAMDPALKNNDVPESPLIVGSAWQCSFDDCNVKTASLKSLLDHFVCHMPRSAFRCGLCPFSGNSKSTVEVHCRRVHDGNMSVLQVGLGAGSEGGEQVVPCGISISATGSTYECPFCPYSDSFPNNVNRHALRHYDFRFYGCGHCGMECLEPCDVEDHCASEHPNMPVLVKTNKKPDSLNACNDEPCGSDESRGHRFQCFKCAFESMDLKGIRAHCRAFHEPLSIFIRIEPPEQNTAVAVDVPNEELNTDEHEQHTAKIRDGKHVDVAETKYYCNYCGYAADCHADLESHWQSQHNQLPFIVSVPQPSYQCPQCEFTSMDIEVVKRHVTNHLKRYMCQKCGKEVHTFVEGVQHSKTVHPNVALELIPHPSGTEKAKKDLFNGIRVIPILSKCSDNPGVFVAPRSGRKMARKQCRSSKFTPRLKVRASARKGPVMVEKKRTFVLPRPTEEEMNQITCTVTKSMGFKFKGVFSLRQLSEKLLLFPTSRVLGNVPNV